MESLGRFNPEIQTIYLCQSMPSSGGQFGRFLLTGLFNTLNGYAAVILLQFVTGMPLISNLVGYLFSGVVGYFAHSLFTFRTKASSLGAFRYAVVLGFSYLINLLVLQVLLQHLPPIHAQVIAVTVFTISCYVGQSRITFRR
jgi:putative flippase GtrA